MNILNLFGLLFLILIFYNYILPYLLVFFSKDQNFKEKYGKWALVTGGSNGIGKEISKRLASQGISLIIVSKDVDNMNEFLNELNVKYSGNSNSNNNNIMFLPIILDLSSPSSISKLKLKLNEFENQQLLKISDIKIIFNNVGYLTMESLNQTSYNEKLKMIQCNVLTSVEITDYFYRIWLEESNEGGRKNNNKKNGAILFTSSITGLFPTPFSAIYSSGKSFITTFTKSLYIEAKYNNIDVFAIQPGRVDNTLLFDNLPNLLILKLLKLLSQQPSDVVDIMFRSIGRYGIVIFDSGLFGVLASFLTNIFGINLNTLICYFISNYLLIDFKIYKQHNNNNNNNNNEDDTKKNK